MHRHKERNVLEHLVERDWPAIKARPGERGSTLSCQLSRMRCARHHAVFCEKSFADRFAEPS